MSAVPAFLRERSCRVCGCTQTTACTEPDTGRPCCWAEPDLCSACVQRGAATPEEAPLTSPKPPVPAGYRENPHGHLIPEAQIPAHELLEDQLVAKIACFAQMLSAQIARFKGHTFEDCATHLDLLAEQYGIRPRGLQGKGNVTFRTFDARWRVQIQVQDRMVFGPGLQNARTAIDECLRDWTADARSELQAVISETFRTDREGQINRSAVFSLLRLPITDERWRSAMKALQESIRTEGSKTYLRIQYRRDSDGGWNSISLDLASAVVPEGMTASHVPASGEPVAAPAGGA